MATSTRFSIDANKIKRAAASVAGVTGLSQLGLKFQGAVHGRYIRAVNYHAIQRHDVTNFRRHLEWYSREFANVSYEGLKGFLSEGEWDHDRPGILLTFDDGTKSHFEVVAPLLAEFGFTGWFFVPAGLLDEGQEGSGQDPLRDNNLTIPQLRRLAERHIICSHGESHIRLSRDVEWDVLQNEIERSKNHLESLVGRPVPVFGWIGGEEWAYCEAAAALVRKNYDLAFLGSSDVIVPRNDPYQLCRSNIEADNPLSLVKFQLSGLIDLYFYRRRKKVLKILSAAAEQGRRDPASAAAS